MATELTLRRVLPFPPAAVFAAWIDPARLAGWMSPFGAARADVDARVGGRFRIVMLGPDRTIEHTGEYREVDPPRRLVFTWRSPYTGAAGSLVTIELRPVDGGTELTLVHARLPADRVEPHAGGWGSLLDGLARHLADGEE